MVAMHEASVTATCLPVRLDDGDWQAAVFIVVPAAAACLSVAEGGRTVLPGSPFAVQVEADLHEHEHGTVFELDLEIHTPAEPLAASLLFLTGHSSAHFEALTLLVEQAQVPLFLGDEYCRVLVQQRVPLGQAARTGLRALLDEAVRRDAVIRLTGRYDPDAAFADALSRRAGTTVATPP